MNLLSFQYMNWNTSFQTFGYWSGVKAFWSAEYAVNQAASRVYLREKTCEILQKRFSLWQQRHMKSSRNQTRYSTDLLFSHIRRYTYNYLSALFFICGWVHVL